MLDSIMKLINSSGPSEDPAGFKRIALNASIDADLSEEQKREFLDTVYNRCPVHDNLLHPTLVTHRVNG